VVRDEDGNGRFIAGVDPTGSPRMALATPGGQALAELSVYGAHAPRLALMGEEGREFFEVTLESDGSTRLGLSDRFGQPRAILGARPDGSPTLALVDRDRMRPARVPVELEQAFK
jgi:hypothetical protein